MGNSHGFYPGGWRNPYESEGRGEDRMCNGIQWAGSCWAEEQTEALVRKLEDYAKEDTLFVLSGSIPRGVEPGNGCSMVAISLGAMGALLLTGNRMVRCPGLKVRAHSTVGAGDAMVAVLAYSRDAALGLEETIRLAMAVSAGAVTTVGTKPPSWAVVNELMEQVVLENL